MRIRITSMNMNRFCLCLINADAPSSTTLCLQGCRFDDVLFPAETCSGPVISWTEIHGRLPDRPAKRCGSTRNRYASALNPKRPRYICQACPEKPPPVQMLSPLRLHQKIISVHPGGWLCSTVCRATQEVSQTWGRAEKEE